MRKVILCMGLILVVLVAAGCSGSGSIDEENGAAIRVVTTIFPLAEMIEQLGGEWVDVSYLLPAGASPHTFEPTVEQARHIAGAHLFVFVGAGLDDWAFRLTEAAGGDPVILELAETLALLESGPYYRLEEAGHRDDHRGHDHEHGDHDHGPGDPHFWLDPLLVRDEICPRIFGELAAILPEQAPYFETRLDEYRRELTLLHEEIAAVAAGFTQREFIAFHSAWQYFARRYGLEELAVIAEFPGQEPSAGWVAELVKIVAERRIGAILTEPQFSPALAARIAAESGIKVLVADPLGGEDLPGRSSYLELMRFNLNVFQEALE